MKIYLVRHGKSDKSLKDKLPHNEFELKRGLIDGEEEKAAQLGQSLKQELGSAQLDLVFSGKERSRQTIMAIANGLGLSKANAVLNLREDFGLIYLTTEKYWQDCEEDVKNGTCPSHADYFLQNPPDDPQTFRAEHMKQNMRSVIRRAIERNTFLKKDVSVMVSHEPVLSLCLSDLTGKSVTELGGSFNELEYVEFTIDSSENSLTQKVILHYRRKEYLLGL